MKFLGHLRIWTYTMPLVCAGGVIVVGIEVRLQSITSPSSPLASTPLSGDCSAARPALGAGLINSIREDPGRLADRSSPLSAT